MSSWYIYLIRCRSGTLYTGITTDVERRFAEHCSGRGAKALRGKGPLALVLKQRVGDKSRASKLEASIKQLPKSAKEELVRGTNNIEDLLPE